MAQSSTIEDDGRVGRTAELLGGRRTLLRTINSRLDAHDLLRDGLPGHALDHLIAEVALFRMLSRESVEQAIGHLPRGQEHGGAMPALSLEQGGRTWKFAEVLSRTIDVLGSREEAEIWLGSPATALDQRKPIDLLSTPAGVEAVEEHLTRLEYGVYT